METDKPAPFTKDSGRHRDSVMPLCGRRHPSTLRLPADLDVAIDALAQKSNANRSAVIKSLLRRALNLPEPAPRDPLACDPKMEKN